MAKGKKQVADLSNPPLEEVKTTYHVACPLCKSESDLVLPVAGLLVIQHVECHNPECLAKFNWNVEANSGEVVPAMSIDEIPAPEPLTQTEEENKVVAEALKGIDEALGQGVLPIPEVAPSLPFSIGDVIVVGGKNAIILDYEKFVKYTYGLIILGNPGLATSYVSQAGKGKLFQLLGITDRAIQDKTWMEFKALFNQLYNKG